MVITLGIESKKFVWILDKERIGGGFAAEDIRIIFHNI